MPPAIKPRTSSERCCPHCNRKWDKEKSGDYRALPDMEKLYLHFMHFQQVCTRAMSFIRQKEGSGRYRYLLDQLKGENSEAKRDADDKHKKKMQDKPKASPKKVEEEIQTINIGGKTYRITRDVVAKEPEASEDGAASKKRKNDGGANENGAKKPKTEENGDEKGASELTLSDNDLRASLMAAMNGEDLCESSPQFELAKRMWKFVMSQMSEAENKTKPEALAKAEEDAEDKKEGNE